MAHLNTVTGLWEDDADGPAPVQAGAVGAQADLPQIPVAPAAPPPPPVEPAPPVLTPAEIAARDAAAGVQQIPATAQPMPPTAVPPSRVVTPAEASNLAAIDANSAARIDTAQGAATVGNDKALADQARADREAADLAHHQAEKTRIEAAAQERIAKAEALAQADTEKYRSMGIKDPDADQSFGNRLLAAIAIGLGQYSAAMTGGKNTALEIIQGATARNIQRQKDEIALAERKAQGSRENVEGLQKNFDRDMKQLDLKHAALLESAAARWKQELARIGVPQAQIEGNKNIQTLEAEALQKRQGVLQGIRDDETSLAKAEIAANATKAAAGIRAAARGAGGAGGGKAGPGGMGALGELQAFLVAHPGDNEGAYKEAERLGIKDPKLVKEAIAQNKGDEGQRKNATSSATMLRSIRGIEDIQAKKFAPSSKDWVTWQKNQDDVKIASGQAEKGSVLGSLAARGAQGVGALAKTEYEGLSPQAASYFGYVKRILESVGREQSGAAISRNEWDNFGGQYGLQAPGGLDAAKEYARDRMTLSGVAGRQLDAAGAVPKDSRGGGPTVVETRRTKSGKILEKLSDGTIRER